MKGRKSQAKHLVLQLSLKNERPNNSTRLKIIVRDEEKNLRLFVFSFIFASLTLILLNFMVIRFLTKYYSTFSKNILIIWFHQNGFLEKSCSLPQSL
jgi:hypothetical protein